jgi:hypothetical protein
MPDDSVIIRHEGERPDRTWGRPFPRYADGALDPTFKLSEPFGLQKPEFISPMPDGKLVVAWGTVDGSTWVSRHQSNGAG